MKTNDPIKVLVVDDSVVVRKLLSDILSEDPDLEVVGVASDGDIAIDKVKRLNPDIVTLDLEMPKMSGLEVLSGIRELEKTPTVLMVSAFTESGAKVTLEALQKGAADYIAKPSGEGKGNTKEEFALALRSKVKALGGKKGKTVPASQPNSKASTSSVKNVSVNPTSDKSVRHSKLEKKPAHITMIGVSTGGPNALKVVLDGLSKDFPTPILIAQHMPPMFTKLLATRLDGTSSLKVVEASDGEIARAGTAYIAPGDFHMTASLRNNQWTIHLDQNPPEHSCRPAVDPLFRVVAKASRGCVLAVMLTGMGQDGLIGSQVVQENGGTVFCQDEETSIVWGMPGCVTEADLADQVLPLPQIASRIEEYISLYGHRMPERLLKEMEE